MSKTIEIKDYQAGNFICDLDLELADDTLDLVIEAGITKLLANPVNQWTKDIAYPGKDKQRPKGFKLREHIPYSVASAAKLEKFLGMAKVRTGEKDAEGKAVLKDLGVMDVKNMREYTGAESATPVYRDQRKFVELYLASNNGKLASGEPRTVESFCATRKIAVPTIGEPYQDEESGETVTPTWADDLEFLARVKAWQEAQAAQE